MRIKIQKCPWNLKLDNFLGADWTDRQLKLRVFQYSDKFMHGFINFLIVLLRSLTMLLSSIDLIYTRLKLRELNNNGKVPWVIFKVMAVAYESFPLQSLSHSSNEVLQRWS